MNTRLEADAAELRREVARLRRTYEPTTNEGDAA